MNFFFRVFPIYKYKITGKSMEPTISNGDVLLVNRIAYLFTKPKENDIVACKDPRDKKILIKRITLVQGNTFFVEGDNKEHSTDSREFGMIEKSDIIGKILI